MHGLRGLGQRSQEIQQFTGMLHKSGSNAERYRLVRLRGRGVGGGESIAEKMLPYNSQFKGGTGFWIGGDIALYLQPEVLHN